jgi:hypothetical protein
LAARIVKLLNLTEVNHISDNAPFVNIPTGRYRGPHDWKTRPLIKFSKLIIQASSMRFSRSAGMKK